MDAVPRSGHADIEHVSVDDGAIGCVVAERQDDLVELQALGQMGGGNRHAVVKFAAARVDQSNGLRFLSQPLEHDFRVCLCLADNAKRLEFRGQEGHHKCPNVGQFGVAVFTLHNRRLLALAFDGLKVLVALDVLGKVGNLDRRAIAAVHKDALRAR